MPHLKKQSKKQWMISRHIIDKVTKKGADQ